MKLLLPLIALLLTACSQTALPGDKPPLGQDSFASYQQQTRQWLRRHRHFTSPRIDAELDYNTPQQWLPAGTPRGGILLVHGLGDSPYSFIDLAPRLAQQGFMVRTVLLPGHGSNPQDLITVSIADWQRVVHEQTRLLQRDAGTVYLGGFSTGGNLVTSEALQNPGIAGLLLFSPAFKSGSRFDWLAPLAADVKPWLRAPDGGGDQQSPVRYLNVPTNGFGQFYKTSAVVRDALAERRYDKPVLMVLAQHDSVLNVDYIREAFSEHFSHPQSRLIWYGQPPQGNDPRMQWRSDYLPQQRISQFSHMSVLFSPDNPLYGDGGSLRFCQNGQSSADDAACRRGAPVWYSDWGYREDGKVHARLTFNPYFEWQMSLIRQLLGPAPLQAALPAAPARAA